LITAVKTEKNLRKFKRFPIASHFAYNVLTLACMTLRTRPMM